MLEIAQRAAPGESSCGDAVYVYGDDPCLIAVVDGLGHGEMAAQAAEAFHRSMQKHSDEPLPRLIALASLEIAQTRGVAASIVKLSRAQGTLSYAGVGNVELRTLSRKPIRPVNSPGVIGKRLHNIKCFEYQVFAQDLLVFFTDGISSRLDLDHYLGLDAPAMAAKILQDHGKSHDDATCVVVRV